MRVERKEVRPCGALNTMLSKTYSKQWETTVILQKGDAMMQYTIRVMRMQL